MYVRGSCQPMRVSFNFMINICNISNFAKYNFLGPSAGTPMWVRSRNYRWNVAIEWIMYHYHFLTLPSVLCYFILCKARHGASQSNPANHTCQDICCKTRKITHPVAKNTRKISSFYSVSDIFRVNFCDKTCVVDMSIRSKSARIIAQATLFNNKTCFALIKHLLSI